MVGGLISTHFECLGNQSIGLFIGFFGIFYLKFKTLLGIFSCDLLRISSELLVEVWYSRFRFYIIKLTVKVDLGCFNITNTS